MMPWAEERGRVAAARLGRPRPARKLHLHGGWEPGSLNASPTSRDANGRPSSTAQGQGKLKRCLDGDDSKKRWSATRPGAEEGAK